MRHPQKCWNIKGNRDFFQPNTVSKQPVAHLSSASDNYPVSQKPVFKRFSACLQAFSFAYIHEKTNKKPTQREFIESSRKIIYISLIYFFLVTLVTPLKITRYKTICHDIPRHETIHITQRTRGTKQSPCLFRLKLQLLHTHHDVLPHRVFVGMVEDFGRLLMQQPVPIFVLLGFHFLIKASVVICYAHSEHLLQNRNSRLISFENQAAMYAIFSSANWKL